MSKPVVAIVGRPNVGKSTLFNVLAGDKISIVKDTPGVTRDRIYADVSWLDNDFTIIDTGGIEPDSGDVILSQMREQAQIAIDTADVIVFITDVHQGLVDSDAKVADMLRRSGKPVVLAVNKVDSIQKYMMDVYEFYNLGIGEPFAISAANRQGLGDMLDEVVKHFPEDAGEDEDSDIPKIAIVGKPNVGKSSLINKLLGEDRVIVSDIAGTTRDVLEQYINLDGIGMNIIDTAGIRDTEDIVEKIGVDKSMKEMEDADLILFIVDSSIPLDENDKQIMSRIKDKQVIILQNKSDLSMVVAKEEINKYLDKPVILISAKENTGFEEFYDILNEMFFHGNLKFNDEIYITNIRHKNALMEALSSIKMAQQSIEDGMPEDFLSIDLMAAYEKLGYIIGESVEDDLVDTIFREFCMGK